MTVGLVFLLDDPDALHPPDDRLRIFRLELKFGRQDHGFIEVRVPVGKAQVVAFAHLDQVGRVEDGGTADELADRPLPAPGIAAQRSAHCPGNAREDSSPPSPVRADWEMSAVSGTAAPASTTLSRTVTSEKNSALEVDHEGVDPLVPHEEVGATRQGS